MKIHLALRRWLNDSMLFIISLFSVFSHILCVYQGRLNQCLCDIHFIVKFFFPPFSLCISELMLTEYMYLCVVDSVCFVFSPPIHQRISARLKRNSLPWCWVMTSSVKTSTPRKISTSIYTEVSHLWWKLLTSITEPPPKSSLMKTSNPIPPPPPHNIPNTNNKQKKKTNHPTPKK